MTILLIIVVVLCLQMTITVKLSFIEGHKLGFGMITSDMEIREGGGGVGYNLITNRLRLMKHHPKNIQSVLQLCFFFRAINW